MLYTRREIVELVHAIAPDLQSLLIALMWFASHANANLVTLERYGLLQVDLTQARQAGFTGNPNELLQPETNIRIGAQLLNSLGLIQYCGRALANQIPAIVQLANFLESQANGNIEDTQNVANLTQWGQPTH